MFEAHFSSVEDFQGLETIAHSWTKTYYRRHQVSFQTLRIWFAKGKVSAKGEVQRKTFAYIEYQDERGNNRYCSLTLSPELSVVEALREVVRAATHKVPVIDCESGEREVRAGNAVVNDVLCLTGKS